MVASVVVGVVTRWRCGRLPVRVTVDAVEADGAVADLLGQHRAQFQGRSQFHAHRAHQVLLGQQRQRAPVDRVLSEYLQSSSNQILPFFVSNFFSLCFNFFFFSFKIIDSYITWLTWLSLDGSEGRGGRKEVRCVHYHR